MVKLTTGQLVAIGISAAVILFLVIFLPLWLTKSDDAAATTPAPTFVPPNHHSVHVTNVVIMADVHVDPVYDENQPGTDTVFSKVAGAGGTARIARELKFITHCASHETPPLPSNWTGSDTDPNTWTFDNAELERFQFNRTAYGFKRSTDPPVQMVAAAVRDASDRFSNDPTGVQLVLFLGDVFSHNSAYTESPKAIAQGNFRYVHHLMNSTAQQNQISGSIPVYLGCIGNNCIQHNISFRTGSDPDDNLFMTNVFIELGMFSGQVASDTFENIGCFSKQVTDVGIISLNSNIMLDPDASPQWDADKEGAFFEFFQQSMDIFKANAAIRQILIISHYSPVAVTGFGGWPAEMFTKAEKVINTNRTTSMIWFSAHLHDVFTASIGTFQVPVLGFASISGSQSGGKSSYYRWNIDSNSFVTSTVTSLSNHMAILENAQFVAQPGRLFPDPFNLCSSNPADCVACT